MSGIIGAIIIGLIIALAEKGMNKGSRQSQPSRSRTVPAPQRSQRPQRPPRRPVAVVETQPEPVKPFLSSEDEGVRVTAAESAPMAQMPRPAFTKSQQELRRTIILGEILRRKF